MQLQKGYGQIALNIGNVSVLFTFLERPFFFLVTSSISSKSMMNISVNFPWSNIMRGPSSRDINY